MKAFGLSYEKMAVSSKLQRKNANMRKRRKRIFCFVANVASSP